MTYLDTNWVDGLTEADAANLNKLEQGVVVAQATADTALATRPTREQVEALVNEVANRTTPGTAAGVATANVPTRTGVPTKANSEAWFDGVEVTMGQTVLLVGQTNKTQNGLWVIEAGAWARPASFASGTQQTGVFVPVAAGVSHKGDTWILSNKTSIIVDTTEQTWIGNSAGSGVVGPESIGTEQLANKAVTAAKVGAGVVTNLEKNITAEAEVVKLNMAEASTFIVKMKVAKIKFVIENAPPGPVEITLLLEWTAAGGATTFSIETPTATKIIWVGGVEPQWETAATSLAFISVLSIAGTNLYGLAASASGVRFNEALNDLGAGKGALEKITTGSNNVCVGNISGQLITTGEGNTALGSKTLALLTTGKGNTAIGETALNKQTGNEATAIGYEALSQSTANNVTAVGSFALANNTTGTGNTGVGHNVLFTNKEGTGNTAIGANALEKATGSNNTANGSNALLELTTGAENVAIGRSSMSKASTTVQSVGVGGFALGSLTTGVHNTAIGYNAGGHVVTGEGNVFIGWEAGKEELGSNKLYIANSSTTTPLVLGDFEAKSLVLTPTGGKVAFFGGAPAAKPEVTGSTVTAKQLAEALATLSLIKVN